MGNRIPVRKNVKKLCQAPHAGRKRRQTPQPTRQIIVRSVIMYRRRYQMDRPPNQAKQRPSNSYRLSENDEYRPSALGNQCSPCETPYRTSVNAIPFDTPPESLPDNKKFSM